MSQRTNEEEQAPPIPQVGDDVLESLSRFGRGDRPLSLLDQIERGTLDLDLAAWLTARVSAGASYIVGARPGNAGKTTTMRSLLSFAPAGVTFVEALPGQVDAIEGSVCCAVSHELSNHPPPAYLWDQDVRDFFALPGSGHMVAANLHADDLDETRGQICTENGVTAEQFRSVSIFLFLRVEGEGGEAVRWIEEVAYSEGTTDHCAVFTRADGLLPGAPRDGKSEADMRAFLEAAMVDGLFSPPELRRRFLGSGLAS
jgi:hypothetical protein